VPALRISVPDDLAAALVAEGHAVRPYATRGAGPGDVVHVVIEGVNAAAAVVTIAGSLGALRVFARRLREHAAGRTVVLERRSERRRLVATPGDPDSAVEQEDAVVAALAVALDPAGDW
jgi:hypothetical protein